MIVGNEPEKNEYFPPGKQAITQKSLETCLLCLDHREAGQSLQQ